jgi:hypothetical protein
MAAHCEKVAIVTNYDYSEKKNQSSTDSCLCLNSQNFSKLLSSFQLELQNLFLHTPRIILVQFLEPKILIKFMLRKHHIRIKVTCYQK